jgi:Holliday junction resolvasome RuvABC endonuclease subunit
MGITLWEWRLDSSRFVVVESFTAAAKDNNPVYNSISEVHGNRVARMYFLADTLADTLRRFNPHAIIAESPYMGRFPQAFAALVECVSLIRNTVYSYNRYLPLYQVDPPTAKKAAGVKIVKKSDKEDVRRALRARTDIEWQVDLESLDEHSVDSVAVGLYYLLNLA